MKLVKIFQMLISTFPQGEEKQLKIISFKNMMKKLFGTK
jgi:hypothetical protein